MSMIAVFSNLENTKKYLETKNEEIHVSDSTVMSNQYSNSLQRLPKIKNWFKNPDKISEKKWKSNIFDSSTDENENALENNLSLIPVDHREPKIPIPFFQRKETLTFKEGKKIKIRKNPLQKFIAYYQPKKSQVNTNLHINDYYLPQKDNLNQKKGKFDDMRMTYRRSRLKTLSMGNIDQSYFKNRKLKTSNSLRQAKNLKKQKKSGEEKTLAPTKEVIILENIPIEAVSSLKTTELEFYSSDLQKKSLVLSASPSQKMGNFKMFHRTRTNKKRKRKNGYPWTLRGDIYSPMPASIKHKGPTSSVYVSYWSKRLEAIIASDTVFELKDYEIGYYIKKGIRRDNKSGKGGSLKQKKDKIPPKTFGGLDMEQIKKEYGNQKVKNFLILDELLIQDLKTDYLNMECCNSKF